MSDGNPLFHVSWDEFHRESMRLSEQLLNKGPWRGIIAITRGGMVPATIIARELDIRHIDTLCISSYQHDQQGELNILKEPASDGEGILLIDDMVDTGKTAKVARELLPNAYFAVIYAKPLGEDQVDHFVTKIPQETWIHFPWDTQLSYAEPLADQKKNT